MTVEKSKSTNEEIEEKERLLRESRCLVLFAHGEPMVLTWMAGAIMAECIDHPEGESFNAEDLEVDKMPSDGLYIGEFGMVDMGAESWEMPHIRDYVLGIRKLRLATAEEWESHRRGEFPWEPLAGSRFYEDQKARIEAARQE